MNWSLGLILRLAGLATGISVVVGLWLGFILANRKLPFDGYSIPTQAKWLSAAPILLYWIGAIGSRDAALWPLTRIGLVLAGVLSAGPDCLSEARSMFASLDPGYGKAARSLGASEWRVFSRIHLPLAFRPVLVSATGAFVCLLVELALFWWFDVRMFS